MNANTFREALARAGSGPDHAIVLTLIGPTMRWPLIRPTVLEERPDGTRVYGLNRRQCRMMVLAFSEKRERESNSHHPG